MKPEEDIGSLIKSKLQSAQKASKEATWERIQHSLEERRRKRRVSFYFKVGSAGLLILLGALFVFTYVSMNTESTIITQEEAYSTSDSQKTVSTKKSNEISENFIQIEGVSKNKNENNLEVSSTSDQEISEKRHTAVISIDFDKDLEKSQSGNKTKTQVETIANNENNENTPNSNSPNATKNEKALDTIVNRNDVPVTQTTQKVYYYYNSKNGQEISSTNKKVIDSIVEVNHKKQDSLKAKNQQHP